MKYILIQFFFLYKNQRSVRLLLFVIIIPIDNLLVVEGQVSQVLSGYFQVICDARCHHYQGFQVLPSEKERLKVTNALPQKTQQTETGTHTRGFPSPLHILY